MCIRDRTTTGSFVEQHLRKAWLILTPANLEFSHEMLNSGSVILVILGTDIMNAYGCVMNVRNNKIRINKGLTNPTSEGTIKK